MGGFGGNAILIDIENSRIVVLNSLHYNYERFKYNHKKLLLDPIKKRQIKKKKKKKFTYSSCSIINISINTHEIH